MALDATGASFRKAALELAEADRTMYLVARANIRTIAEPAIAAVRQSALDTLPRRGGLNQWVADATIKTSIMTGARTAGVAIRARKPGAGMSGKGHDLPRINAGVARHPVFGNPNAWANTYVRPGFFTKPLDAMAALATVKFLQAMTETSRIAGFH